LRDAERQTTTRINTVPESELLVCPITRQLLTGPSPVEDVTGLGLRRRPTDPPTSPLPGAEHLLLREGQRFAYPVVEGVPILLGPEALVRGPAADEVVNLRDARYAESYEEMEFYTGEADKHDIATHPTETVSVVREVAAMPHDQRGRYPYPPRNWVTHTFDNMAAWDAARHVAPVEGKRVIQIGGGGGDAVKMLVAGAAEAWLATPVLAEALFAARFAEYVGVRDRLHTVVAIGEELPIATGTFDIVYWSGSLHHTVTALAFAESERILKEGGKFAAVDPWRAPLYALGTKIFGKREEEVFCRPITRERLNGLSVFREHEVIQHGALLRYGLIAADKLGLKVSQRELWRLLKADDRLSDRLGLRRFGSSVAILATK
jgi:SAM-dependent methyltransferase/uncharacterized protein YbaR (Trm112 family)